MMLPKKARQLFPMSRIKLEENESDDLSETEDDHGATSLPTSADSAGSDHSTDCNCSHSKGWCPAAKLSSAAFRPLDSVGSPLGEGNSSPLVAGPFLPKPSTSHSNFSPKKIHAHLNEELTKDNLSVTEASESTKSSASCQRHKKPPRLCPFLARPRPMPSVHFDSEELSAPSLIADRVDQDAPEGLDLSTPLRDTSPALDAGSCESREGPEIEQVGFDTLQIQGRPASPVARSHDRNSGRYSPTMRALSIDSNGPSHPRHLVRTNERNWKLEWKKVIWHVTTRKTKQRRSLMDAHLNISPPQTSASEQNVTHTICISTMALATLALARDTATLLNLGQGANFFVSFVQLACALVLLADEALKARKHRHTLDRSSVRVLCGLMVLAIEGFGGLQTASQQDVISAIFRVVSSTTCAVLMLSQMDAEVPSVRKSLAAGVDTIRGRVAKVVFKSCFGIVAVMVLLLHLSTYRAELGHAGVGLGRFGSAQLPVRRMLTAQLKALDAQVKRSRGMDDAELAVLGSDVEIVLREAGYPLVVLEANGTTLWPHNSTCSERSGDVSNEWRGTAVEVVLNQESGRQWRAVVVDEEGRRGAALVRLCATIIGAALLLVSSSLVLDALSAEFVSPMDRMLDSMTSLLNDPLKPLVALHHTATRQRTLREVDIVESSMTNLAGLLQSSFGEAGSKLVRTNMLARRPVHSVPGEVVLSFFGFCDIREFTSLTEALQTQVAKLVNAIARHVHGTVHDHHGCPNKSIGDAFFVVWKPTVLKMSETADNALAAFIRIIQKVESDAELEAWAQRKGVQERLPGYRVRMGFGLHFGWAVQCAIGSKHKVDVSYLSPHVNLSSRLEAATKQYGVSLLLSGETWAVLSPKVRVLCRLIDRVQVVGSCNPVELYTYDVPATMSARSGAAVGHSHPTSVRVFEELPPETTEDFREKFAVAIDCYLGGQDGSKARWHMAKALLEQCLRLRPHDGPCNAILDFMDSAKYEFTDQQGKNLWPGYRSLQFK